MNTSLTIETTKQWQIPDYSEHFWQGRLNNFCLVIPVINEGSRIHSLLAKIHNLGLHKQVDIIIIDGGSTDHSLNPTILKNMGVKALLEKTGSGKLSAQLRCAYAFSLKQGYTGILTIDGNDKDDPVSIPSFINKLNEGYDFVQASRFLPGGEAVNTPLSRLFAIRIIHAPILSLASGFRWTDTTQGFRAYSSKMLLDPKISIFREVFNSYELLAYLSYRVPKLGYRCIEIPTARRYPKGKIPTKISFIRGNWQVVKIMLKTCFGAYNP